MADSAASSAAEGPAPQAHAPADGAIPSARSGSGPDVDPGRDNAARLQSRAYESNFAALPAAELEGTSQRPGPVGTGIDEISVPLVVIAVGFVTMLLGLFFSSFLILGAGLVVLLAGAVWRGLTSRRR